MLKPYLNIALRSVAFVRYMRSSLHSVRIATISGQCGSPQNGPRASLVGGQSCCRTWEAAGDVEYPWPVETIVKIVDQEDSANFFSS